MVICERFIITMRDEFYAITFRKKCTILSKRCRKDIDQWLLYYNEEAAAWRQVLLWPKHWAFTDSKVLGKGKNIQIYLRQTTSWTSDQAEKLRLCWGNLTAKE